MTERNVVAYVQDLLADKTRRRADGRAAGVGRAVSAVSPADPLALMDTAKGTVLRPGRNAEASLILSDHHIPAGAAFYDVNGLLVGPVIRP